MRKIFSQEIIISNFIKLKKNNPYYKQTVRTLDLPLHSHGYLLEGLCYGFSSIYLLACSNILPYYNREWFIHIWTEIANLKLSKIQLLTGKRLLEIDNFFSLVLALQFYTEIIFKKDYNQIFNFLSLSINKNESLFNYIKSFTFDLHHETPASLKCKLLAIKSCLSSNESVSGFLNTEYHAMAIDFSNEGISFFDPNGFHCKDINNLIKYLFSEFKQDFLNLVLYSAKKIGLDITLKINELNFDFHISNTIEKIHDFIKISAEYDSYNAYISKFNTLYQPLLEENPALKIICLKNVISSAVSNNNIDLFRGLLNDINQKFVDKNKIYEDILQLPELSCPILELLILDKCDFNNLRFSFLKLLVNRNRPDMISLLFNAKTDSGQPCYNNFNYINLLFLACEPEKYEVLILLLNTNKFDIFLQKTNETVLEVAIKNKNLLALQAFYEKNNEIINYVNLKTKESLLDFALRLEVSQIANFLMEKNAIFSEFNPRRSSRTRKEKEKASLHHYPKKTTFLAKKTGRVNKEHLNSFFYKNNKSMLNKQNSSAPIAAVPFKMILN